MVMRTLKIQLSISKTVSNICYNVTKISYTLENKIKQSLNDHVKL